MAHLVETMAYAGAVPWHGLGNQLTQKQPIEVWQREAGMDWAIQESPVLFKSETVGLMAWQLANLRLRRGRALTSPQEVFSHLQTLLADYEHEVFALLMLDSKHRVLVFHELFRGTLDGASVYPREVVKIALQYNAAAMILVHNHPSGDPEPSEADRVLTQKLKEALSLVGGTYARPHRGWA